MFLSRESIKKDEILRNIKDSFLKNALVLLSFLFCIQNANAITENVYSGLSDSTIIKNRQSTKRSQEHTSELQSHRENG